MWQKTLWKDILDFLHDNYDKEFMIKLAMLGIKYLVKLQGLILIYLDIPLIICILQLLNKWRQGTLYMEEREKNTTSRNLILSTMESTEQISTVLK